MHRLLFVFLMGWPVLAQLPYPTIGNSTGDVFRTRVNANFTYLDARITPVSTLPTAAAAVVGKIYEWTGATTANVCPLSGAAGSGGSAIAFCVTITGTTWRSVPITDTTYNLSLGSSNPTVIGPGQGQTAFYYGAKGDLRTDATCSISASSSTLTCTSAPFTTLDVGKYVAVSGASAYYGVSGMTLTNTGVSGCVSGNTVTFSSGGAIVQLFVSGGVVTVPANFVMTPGSYTGTAPTATVAQGTCAQRPTGTVAVSYFPLVTTIATYVSATQVTLTAAAGTTVSSASTDWGTDDTAAIQSGIDALYTAGGGDLIIPAPYKFLLRSTLHHKAKVRILGMGQFAGSVLKVAAKAHSVLSSNAASGQKNLIVTSTAPFKVGQEVTVFDDSNTGYGLGDSGRIATINSGTSTITLDTNLFRSYTTANHAYIFSAFSAISLDTPVFVSGLVVGAAGQTDTATEDLEIDCNGSNQSQGNKDVVQGGITGANTHRAKIRRNYIHDCPLGDILTSHYVDGSYDGSEYMTITDNYTTTSTFKDCIHLHGAKKSIISNNHAVNCQDYGIYIISGADNVWADNSMVGGTVGYYVIDTVGDSFSGGSIVTPTLDGVNISVTAATADMNRFSGINVRSAGRFGFNIASAATNTLIQGNTITAAANTGVNASGAKAAITGNLINSTAPASGIDSTGAGSTLANNLITKTAFGVCIFNSGLATGITGNVCNNGSRVAITNTGNYVVISGNANVTSNAVPITNTGTNVSIIGNTNSGALMATVGSGCTTYPITSTNAAFVAAATTATVALFTLPAGGKVVGVTTKHSVIFSDGAGAMTEVGVTVGDSSSATAYAASQNIGEATAVADGTFTDSAALHKSTTMAAAGRAVNAYFTATGANFGTGSATSLTTGTVAITVCTRAVQ